MDMALPLRPLAKVRMASSCQGNQEGCSTKTTPSLAWYGHTLVKPRSAEAGRTFPFLKLPAKLRCMVLYHAGLVFDENKPRGLLLPGGGRSIDCCGECGDQNTERYSENSDCYCSRGKTGCGYTLAYSKTCTCHQPRSSAVFAINRECREEAIKIYYTYNTFFVKGNPDSIQQDIESVPEDRLQYIKKLSLTFSNVPGHNDDMFGVTYGGNNYIRKEKESEWTKIKELIRCLETDFWLRTLPWRSTYRMSATIPAAIDHVVKTNLRTIFIRFWIWVKTSKLNRVVVNFVRYDNMRPKDITKVMVLNPGTERSFNRGLDYGFRGIFPEQYVDREFGC